MSFIELVRSRARELGRTIVFPEGTEPRTLAAVHQLSKERIVRPILLGDTNSVHAAARSASVELGGIDVVDPRTSPHLDEFADVYRSLRQGKDRDDTNFTEVMTDPIYFGTMMVREGLADGYLAGAVTTTAKTVQAGLRILKTRPGVRRMSSLFFMIHPDESWFDGGLFAMADAAINIAMDAQTMAEIAVTTAHSARDIAGMTPRVAMLSYSTLGSGTGERVEMVREATALARKMDPNLEIEGEIQADAAIVPEVGRLKSPASRVAGRANVLIFPSIDAANIAYKLIQRLGRVEAVGPILQGLSKPANDLSRGCSIDDIVNTAAITALQCP